MIRRSFFNSLGHPKVTTFNFAIRAHLPLVAASMIKAEAYIWLKTDGTLVRDALVYGSLSQDLVKKAQLGVINRMNARMGPFMFSIESELIELRQIERQRGMRLLATACCKSWSLRTRQLEAIPAPICIGNTTLSVRDFGVRAGHTAY